MSEATATGALGRDDARGFAVVRDGHCEPSAPGAQLNDACALPKLARISPLLASRGRIGGVEGQETRDSARGSPHVAASSRQRRVLLDGTLEVPRGKCISRRH